MEDSCQCGGSKGWFGMVDGVLVIRQHPSRWWRWKVERNRVKPVGVKPSPQVCGEHFGPSSYRAGSRASRCFGWRHTMGTDLGGVESKPQSAFLHLFLGSTSSSVSGKVLQVPTDLKYLHGTGGWQSTLHRVIWQWSPLGCVSLWYCQVAFFSKRAHCGS